MIERLKLDGYRSFKELDIELKPLNVLIGPNASGKTNLIDFFELMSEAARGQLGAGVVRRGGMSDLVWAREAASIHISVHWPSGGLADWHTERVAYRVELRDIIGPEPFVHMESLMVGAMPGSPADVEVLTRTRGVGTVLRTRGGETMEYPKEQLSFGELAISQVRDRLQYLAHYFVLCFFEQTMCYRELATGPDAPMREAQPPESSVRLAKTGENLASVLSTLRNNAGFSDAFSELELRLVSACPGFERINIPFDAAGKVILALQHAAFPGRHFAAPQLSDGLLKFLCLCAILLCPDPPPLVCIDEPELGLHPGMMPHVAEMLREAAERTQLIVATHSPQLVDHLEAEDIVVTEIVDGATQMTRLNPDDLRDWLSEFRLGDLWMMGHLGGRPE